MWGRNNFESSWADELAENCRKANENHCRDVVLVDESNERRIRELMDCFPDTCWKLPSVILNFQFQMEWAKQNCDTCSPPFHCRIVSGESPLDFVIQPKYLDKTCRNLEKTLESIYENCADEYIFSACHVIPGVACVVKNDSKWVRGQIEKCVGVERVSVRLVDSGHWTIVQIGNLRRLAGRFHRFPPLTLRCVIRGACINALDAQKLDEFRKILKDVDHLARCRFGPGQTEEPFEVDLLHSAVVDQNICAGILPQQRMKHLKIGDDRWDTSDEEEHDLSEQMQTLYIRQFDKALKAISFFHPQFRIAHIENPNLIYLMDHKMCENREQIEKNLLTDWSSFPLLPISWREPGVACAFRDQNGFIRRAFLNNMRMDGRVELFLIDHGRYVEIGREQFEENCKVVVRNTLYCMEPQVFVVSLISERRVHFSVFRLLCETIPVGSFVTFDAFRKSKKIPTRGRLMTDNDEVDELIDLKLREMRIDVDCTALLPYHPKRVNPNNIINFRYDICCPRFLTNASLKCEMI